MTQAVAALRRKLDAAMGWPTGTTERRALAHAAPASPRETPVPVRKPRLEGLAIVFNSLSEDLGGFKERIDRRAVDRTLREKVDVVGLYNHDPGKLLGRVSAQTLRLTVDPRGLRAEIDPPATSDGADVLALVGRGDLRGMSFAFRTISDEWSQGSGGLERLVTDMRVHEVSIVSMPAYPDTTIYARGVPPSRAALQAQHARVGRELQAQRLRLAARWN